MTSLTSEVLDKAWSLGATAQPPIPTSDGGQALIVPEGYHVERLPPLEKPLTRIVQRVTVSSRDSLIEYLKTFKGPQTRVFAQLRAAGAAATCFVAYIDYHAPDEPDRLAHSVSFAPRYSENWVRWRDAQREPMGQRDFAEFIEENRLDIIEPPGANMLDIITKFKATKKVEYDSVVHQNDGSIMIAYSDKVEGARGGGFEVPAAMKLAIPVFFKGTPYEVGVLLRYRMADGHVMFQIKIDRMDYIEADAVDQMAMQISEGAGVPVFMGAVS